MGKCATVASLSIALTAGLTSIASAQVPGRTAGCLGGPAFTLNYTSSSNSEIDIGGLIPCTQHDRITAGNIFWAVGSRVTLNQILPPIDPNFRLQPFQQFEIFRFNTRSGEPVLLREPGFGLEGLTITPVFSATALTLVTSGTPGDANLDGFINFTDLLALAQNYNQAGDWYAGDFNNDDLVNFSDLLALAQNYNQPADLSALPGGDSFLADWSLAQSLVPEPASLAAAALGAVALRRRRR